MAQWVKNLPAMQETGDTGSIPVSGRSSGGGHNNLLSYSCLENSRDGGAWWATVHRVAKSQTRLSDITLTFTFTSMHDYWKNHSLEEMDLSWQNNVAALV